MWTKRGSRPEATSVPFEAPFTVAARQGTLKDAEAWLQAHPDVARVWPGRSRLELNGPLHAVLRVRTRRYQDMHKVATDLRRALGVTALHIFDVDHPVESRWMRQAGLFPFCALQPGTLLPIPSEDRYGLDYRWPDLVAVRIHAEAAPGGGLTSVQVDGEELHPSNDGKGSDAAAERDALLALARVLADLDPDVLLTRNGHTGTVPLLLERIQTTGLHARVRLGRDPDPRRPAQPEQSFSTYGQMVYRAASWDLKGRLHIDQKSKFLQDSAPRNTLHGLVYLSRISNRGAQSVSTHSPGYCIQQIHIDRAQAASVAVPWKRNLVEGWKSLSTLAAVDRGGQVHVPMPGVYEDVWELDFGAYYPSLIVSRNLSSDTLNCDCCPDADMVPDLGAHFCARRQGHQSGALEPFVLHRRYVKALERRRDVDPDRMAWAKAIKSELKAIGVVCFGYARYKHARYGCAEVHQAIQAGGREGMTTAREVAERDGWNLVHGLTDSLFLHKPGATRTDANRLARAITQAVGVPLDVEDHYRWMVTLSAKTHGPLVGAPNRYYACNDQGIVKQRGIATRRHDSPPWLSKAIEAVLEVLAEARTENEFRAALPRARAATHPFLADLEAGRVPLADLAVTITVTRDPDHYKANTLTAAALRTLRRAGCDVQPGQRVQYVVQRGGPGIPEAQRVAPLGLPGVRAPAIDRRHYAKRLAQALDAMVPL